MSAEPGRVLLVSNRLPVTIRWDGNTPSIARSSGGLASALRTVHERVDSLWIGSMGPHLDAASMTEIDRQLRAQRCVRVSVSSEDERTFYRRLSNGIIWPLFHDRTDRLPLDLGGWDAYERINARFADAVAAVYKPGDVVWVHDYHLMRLPLLLRERIPDATIGFFLHVPFPNPEMFLVLPPRELLVGGMLAADVVGFQTRRHRGHFTAACRRLLGVEMDADCHVRHDGRATRLGVFPVGVDADRLSVQASERAVMQKALQFRPGRERLVVGIDRLDYSKGLARRLTALERLLDRYPEWRRNLRFVQVAVPTRDGISAYKQHRAHVEQLVTRINGRFGTPSWTPIAFLHQHLELTDVLALYRAADVLLVTPLRDGMNLVAKEFVAARSDESGVLILSEFAGAAEELSEAVIVNPYDVDALADSIHAGLRMDRLERRQRMQALRARVIARDVTWWADEFLSALGLSTSAPRDQLMEQAG